MAAGDPREATPYRFSELGDSRLEELTLLLALDENSRAVRVHAPDGGLDVAVLDPADLSRAEWGLQAKCNSKRINWDACTKSLDDAVRNWNPSRVTFVFTLPMTRSRIQRFNEHLASRHEDVEVSYWGEHELAAKITRSPHAAAIRQELFHVEDPADLLDRATRVGGPLRSGADWIERQETMDDWLRSVDPHFEVRMKTLRRDEAEPPHIPESAARITWRRGDEHLVADLIPKHRSALAYLPKATAVVDDTSVAKHLHDRVRTLGGRASLGHTTFRIDGLPAPLQGLASELVGEMSVTSYDTVKPWAATLTAETDLGSASIDLDVVQQEHEDSWNFVMAGERNGLRVTYRTVWRHDTESGTADITWTFTTATGSAAERSNALAVVVALHGEGTVTMSDREQRRPQMATAITGIDATPEDLVFFREFYRAIDEIERFSGATLGAPPDEVSSDDAEAVFRVAHRIRKGNDVVGFEKITIEVDSTDQSFSRLDLAHLVLTETLEATLLGRTIQVADRTMRIPSSIIQDVMPLGNGRWQLALVPTAGPSVPVTIEYTAPSSNATEFLQPVGPPAVSV